jgi:hypothetical protein
MQWLWDVLCFQLLFFKLGFLMVVVSPFSTFTLHLVVSYLVAGCLQLFFFTLVDVRYVILYVRLVCISLIF